MEETINWENLECLDESNLIKNKLCAINTQGFFHKGMKSQIYRCKCSKEKEMIICHSCAKNCHNGHTYFEDDTIKHNFICQCAKMSHNYKAADTPNNMRNSSFSKFSKKFNNQHSSCHFIQISNSNCNMKVFKRKNKIVCSFCLINCMKKVMEMCELCPKECLGNKSCYEKDVVLNLESEVCCCNDITTEEKHLVVQNIDNIIKFFRNDHHRWVCDPYKLAYLFMSNDVCDIYRENVYLENQKIIDLIDENQYLNQNEESHLLIKSCRLFNTINRIAIKKNYIELNHKDFTLDKIFSFLNKLFTTIEIKNDIFIKYKYLNLKILRKCFILPKLRFLFYDVIDIDNNTNPLHRILFKPNISLLFKKINIQDKKFYDLLSKIQESIINYNTKVGEDELNIFIKEYLRYLRLIFNFRVDKTFQIKVIKDLLKLLEMISSKKKNFNFNSQLEQLVYSLLLENNDERLLDGILHGQSTGKFSFEYSTLNENLVKMMFCCSLEKIEKESEAEIKKKLPKKTALFDNLISKQDFYLENLNSFLSCSKYSFTLDKFKKIYSEDYKDFVSTEFINLIENFKEDIWNLREHYLNQRTLTKFYEEACRLFENCCEKIKKELKCEEELFYQQIIIYKLGLFGSIISFWSMIKNISAFTLSDNEIINYEKLTTNISKFHFILCNDNPFLIALNFNKIVLNLYFNISSVSNYYADIEDKFFTKDILMSMYIENLKTMIKYKYPLSLVKLVKKLKKGISNTFEDDMDKTFKILKIFGYCLILSTPKTLDIMTDNICGTIRDMMKDSSFFPNFLSGIKNFFKSKESYYKAKIDENFINREEILDNFNSLLNNYEKLLNDKLSIITRICKILNQVGPQYFYFLTVEFNDQKRLASRCISKQGLTFTSFEENVGRFSLRDFIKPYIIKGKKFSPKKLQHLLLTYYKINFENYTKLEIDNYLDLGFLQKIYSEEVKGENNTEDSFENKNAISIFKKYLMNYPKKIKNHEIFLKQPNFYFDYFMNVILFPTSNLIFKYIMKEDTNMAKIKFEIYNIIILFLECYKLFLCVILSDLIDQYEDEMKILINNFFSVVDKDVKLFIRERIEIVSLNLDYAKTPDFPFFDLKKLLTIFSEAIKNISYIDKIKESPKKMSQNMDELDPFYQNFMKQVDIYEDLKSDFESDEMMMIWIFKSEEKAIKNSICLCLVKMFKEEEMDCLTPYIEKNLIIIEMICKIFKADPKHFQDFFTTYSKFINLLNNIVQKQLLYLTQPIVIEFNRLCTNYENSPYKYFVYLIEFLRLMCENHNPCYQTLLFRTIIFEKKISENDELEESKKNNTDYRRKKMEKLTFVDFICTYFIYEVNYNILNLKQKKKDLVSIFKHETNNYYDNIVKCFIDFLIEIIQGTFPFNFLNFNVLQFNFNSFFTKMIDNFSHISLGEEIEYILSQFMRFLIAYMEENENPIENKIEIIKKIFPKKMYNCFIYSVKKLYVKLFKPENLNDVLNKIKIEKDASLLFEEQYKTNPTMMEDPLFILSTNIFYFLKIACSFENHANENFIKILQELESDSKRINEKYLKEMVSNGEIFLFYDKIIKKIEINYQANQIDKDELKEYRTVFKNANMLKQYEDMKKISDIKPEMKVHNVIFLVHPHSLFITNVDTKKFKQDAPYDGFNTKLPYIIDMIPKYEDNVKLRKDLYIDWEFLYQLYNIDYSYCNNASHIISLVINLLLLLTLKLDPLPIGVKEVDIFVFILTLIHLIMILFFMTNYLYFEIFKLREYTHKREIKLSSWDIFNNYWSLITNVDCLPLIWNFIFGFFAILDEKNRWMYSFQLFSVLSIFPTMAIVITSVMIRSKQFLSTALLILIIILFFSSISFYMFKELYFSTELDENLCSSYLLCFLNMLNYGIRSGTIGDFSYIKALDDPFYWSYFLFGWIFFFTVMLIMINVVNGIIVDTFQQLREDHNKKVNDNLNICYICNLHRCKFEIEGQKFESHTDNEHSLTSYLHYLLKINLVDPQDLNSLDFYVLNAVKEKRFDFFPIEKSLKLDKS